MYCGIKARAKGVFWDRQPELGWGSVCCKIKARARGGEVCVVL